MSKRTYWQVGGAFFLAVLGPLALPASAGGESAVVGPVPHERFGPQPVDQAVGDLDPLSASLRWLEPGNALHSSRVRLTESPHAAGLDGAPRFDADAGMAMPGRYRYSAPGVQAMFDRPDYIVRTGPGRRDFATNVSPMYDGALIERVPAGTVFDLRPETALRHLMPQHAPRSAASDHWQDRRIDGRIDTQLHHGSDDRSARRNRHIPADTPIPSRINRRFAPEPTDAAPTEPAPATPAPGTAEPQVAPNPPRESGTAR